MNIKELRPGNLVTNDSGNLITVLEVRDSYFKGIRGIYLRKDISTLHTSLIDIVDIKPIYLVEEHLLKAGFKINEKDSNSIESIFNHSRISRIESNSEGFFYYTGEGYYLKIATLHQMQNLYFAIIQEEMSV